MCLYPTRRSSADLRGRVECVCFPHTDCCICKHNFRLVLWWLLLLCRPLKWQPLRSVGAPGFAAALLLTPTSGRSKRGPQRYVARLSDAKPALLPLALVQLLTHDHLDTPPYLSHFIDCELLRLILVKTCLIFVL